MEDLKTGWNQTSVLPYFSGLCHRILKYQVEHYATSLI